MQTNLDMLKNLKEFRKAMISLPNITLSAEEADLFIDYIVDQSVLKGNARIVKMALPTKNIRAIGLGSDHILHPGATFSSSDYVKTLADDLITLTSKKIRCAIVVMDDDLEDNPEGRGFQDHLMRMVTKQVANELEEAFWIGDTHSLSGFASTDIRSIFDGWRYRLDNSQTGEAYLNDVSGSCTILDAANATTGHTSDFDTAGKIAMISKTAPNPTEYKFAKMLEKLPSKYKSEGLQNFRFYCNDLVVDNYFEVMMERGTVLGDQLITGKVQPSFRTVPIIACPKMATTMEAYSTTKENYDATNGTYTDTVLTHKDNFIIGIQRDIKVEAQREAADEATYFFYTMRVDVAIENVNACVLLKRLLTTGNYVEA